ncbi:hypothetical protein [Anaerophilus nitritogenes]|uniref:hypothetical protein n=1 Tax=Anaerophilus nitritogenes TaxID=2498136 RepID=UPI00101CA4E2|nr:hypothetical protein [Anaerophilus nitritogenes]
MIDFQKIKDDLNDIISTPRESLAFMDKRDKLVEFFGRNEEETLEFIENNIDKFTSKELEEFADNLEDIFLKFYTKTFAERMRKVADKIKDEDVNEAVEQMEILIGVEDEE